MTTSKTQRLTKRITEGNGDHESLQQSIAELKQANMEAATEAVNAVLAKYECIIVPSLTVTQQGNQFRIDIVSK